MQVLIEKLAMIQRELSAPKNQYNGFGKYNYRSCEDILQSVKPLLGDSVILVSDEIEKVGDRYYIKATATFYYLEKSFFVTAFARESLDKKGMDSAQVTGAASSYARKYALNGLLLIDDNKDTDHGQPDEMVKLSKGDQDWVDAVKQNPSNLDQITDAKYKAFIKLHAGV